MKNYDEEERILNRFIDQVDNVDEEADLILKGHLVIEEALLEVISKFIKHGPSLESARLTFAQKAAIAQGLSRMPQAPVWPLITSINALRNELSHKLDSPKRAAKTKAVIDIHQKLNKETDYNQWKTLPTRGRLALAISFSLGFLNGEINDALKLESLKITPN